jgi:hypothetical protein
LRDYWVKGEATEDEKKRLLELYEALAANSPPTGGAESWKEKAEALVAALKSDDGKALEKAVNCGSCHKAHKQ